MQRTSSPRRFSVHATSSSAVSTSTSAPVSRIFSRSRRSFSSRVSPAHSAGSSHRLRRQRRPVRPHGPGQILLIGEADVLPLQRSGHRPGKKTADGASVEAHDASLRHPLCQKSP